MPRCEARGDYLQPGRPDGSGDAALLRSETFAGDDARGARLDAFAECAGQEVRRDAEPDHGLRHLWRPRRADGRVRQRREGCRQAAERDYRYGGVPRRGVEAEAAGRDEGRCQDHRAARPLVDPEPVLPLGRDDPFGHGRRGVPLAGRHVRQQREVQVHHDGHEDHARRYGLPLRGSDGYGRRGRQPRRQLRAPLQDARRARHAQYRAARIGVVEDQSQSLIGGADGFIRKALRSRFSSRTSVFIASRSTIFVGRDVFYFFAKSWYTVYLLCLLQGLDAIKGMYYLIKLV